MEVSPYDTVIYRGMRCTVEACWDTYCCIRPERSCGTFFVPQDLVRLEEAI